MRVNQSRRMPVSWPFGRRPLAGLGLAPSGGADAALPIGVPPPRGRGPRVLLILLLQAATPQCARGLGVQHTSECEPPLQFSASPRPPGNRRDSQQGAKYAPGKLALPMAGETNPQTVMARAGPGLSRALRRLTSKFSRRPGNNLVEPARKYFAARPIKSARKWRLSMGSPWL